MSNLVYMSLHANFYMGPMSGGVGGAYVLHSTLVI